MQSQFDRSGPERLHGSPLTENSTGDRGQIVFKNGASEVAELLLKEHRSWKKRYKRGPRLAFTLTLGSKAVDGKWRIQRVLAEVTARQKVIETQPDLSRPAVTFPADERTGFGNDTGVGTSRDRGCYRDRNARYPRVPIEASAAYSEKF